MAKLNPSGSAFVFCTYLGGTGDDTPEGITADGAGNAHVVGETTSVDFPSVNALQSTLKGPRDGFITKFNPSGSSLLYSTYLGGTDYDTAEDVAVDGTGSAYVVGTFIPVTSPWSTQPSP